MNNKAHLVGQNIATSRWWGGLFPFNEDEWVGSWGCWGTWLMRMRMSWSKFCGEWHQYPRTFDTDSLHIHFYNSLFKSLEDVPSSGSVVHLTSTSSSSLGKPVMRRGVQKFANCPSETKLSFRITEESSSERGRRQYKYNNLQKLNK